MAARGSRKTIRVAIVDDHPITRIGIATVLSEDVRIEVLLSTAKADDLERTIRRRRIDVVVIDTHRPGDRETVATIRSMDPRVKALVLAGSENGRTMKALLDAGADGYVSKRLEADVLLQGVVALGTGAHQYIPDALVGVLERAIERADERSRATAKAARLSARQKEIIRLVGEGLSNKEIGKELGSSENAVKQVVKRLCTRFVADNRAELIRIAASIGLLD